MLSLEQRVFILGSGFSASMGLPTLLNLFHEIMERPERSGESDKENVLNSLEILYPHFQKNESPPSYPPFEEFLSLVFSAADLPFFDSGYWDLKWRSALRLLTDCLAEKSKEAEGFQLLKNFVRNLRDGDIVITFNWDNLIERALLSISREVNFLSRDQSAVTILKLHGSLNWVEIPEGTSLKHPESVKFLSEKVVSTPDFLYYDVWDILDMPPLIVPPIFSKRVPVGGFFQNIWHEAHNSIIDAECVCVIGYSIPNDDLQARSLLRIAWAGRDIKRSSKSEAQDKYILIDPNPAVCGKYASLISGSFNFHQAYFSEQLFPLIFDSHLR